MTIPLFEAGSMYAYSLPQKPGGIAHYQSRNNIPSVVVLPTDTDDLKTMDKALVIRMNPAGAKKERRARIGSDYTFVDMYDDLISADNVRDYIDDMSKYPKFFKFFELNGRDRIYKFLTTDLRMPTAIWKKHIGDVPEIGDAHVERFHNATVMVPDNMSPRARQSVMGVLETVFQALKNSGFGFLFGANIRFFDAGSRVLGTYYPDEDEMRVSPRIKRSGMSVFTLLHEYVHRLFDKFMTPEQRQAVRDKYVEVRRAGGVYRDPQKVKLQLQIMQAFPVGSWVLYTGTKRGLKAQGPSYRILDYRDHDGRAILAGEKDPDLNWVSVNPVKFINNPRQWKPLGQNVENLRKLEDHEIDTEEWFPTDYSQKNHEEWICELLALYMLGKLQGEPAQWIREFFG